MLHPETCSGPRSGGRVPARDPCQRGGAIPHTVPARQTGSSKSDYICVAVRSGVGPVRLSLSYSLLHQYNAGLRTTQEEYL